MILLYSQLLMTMFPVQSTPCQQRPHLFHLCGAQFGSRIPSLRTNICGRVTHDNVRQIKSTNDAVLIVVPFHEKVHEFLTLLNGCQVLCTTFYETYVDRVLNYTLIVPR